MTDRERPARATEEEGRRPTRHGSVGGGGGMRASDPGLRLRGEGGGGREGAGTVGSGGRSVYRWVEGGCGGRAGGFKPVGGREVLEWPHTVGGGGGGVTPPAS